MMKRNKGEHKSLTELAMRNRREAYTERRSRAFPMDGLYERKADELLILQHAPDVGHGGEVVREQVLGTPAPRNIIRETLQQGADRTAEDASIRRADLLMQPSFDCVAMGIDAAASIEAANSIEKMLAHQMAVAHEMAMTFAGRAMSFEHERAGDQVEACRCANAAARLMSAFQSAALTLQRLRSGGNQTVTVQHVNVQAGAQAVIGNVQGTGGQTRGGNNAK